MALVCLFAEGHLLLEDVPGVGKTTLARALAASVARAVAPHPVHARPAAVRRHRRHDLQPGAAGEFEFHPGPVFANIVIADEINRASPKTQSALLEVMEERQVTVDGVAAPGAPAVPGRRHAEPGRDGRHLPAARGAARPVPDASCRSATRTRRSRSRCCAAPPPAARPTTSAPVTDTETVGAMIRLPTGSTSPTALRATRSGWPPRPATHPQVRVGVSPRGVIALPGPPPAYALTDGRGYVLPEDLKALVEPVLRAPAAAAPDAATARRHRRPRCCTRCSSRRSPCRPRRRGLTARASPPPGHRRLLVAAGACCSSPGSRSATRNWPCSAPRHWSAPAAGLVRPRPCGRKLAPSSREVDRTGSCAASCQPGPRCSNASRSLRRRLVARDRSGDGDGRRPAGPAAAGPADRGQLPVPTARRGVVPDRPAGDSRRDPLGLVGAPPAVRRTAQVWVHPAVHPIAPLSRPACRAAWTAGSTGYRTAASRSPRCAST